MGTVTLTVDQLQDLLQAQTSQLEQHFTTQIAALQSNLEATLEEKLQAKFDQAEENVKQFMKESIEEEDPDGEIIVESTKKTFEDLQFLKDHVLQMEQSVSRFVMGDIPEVPVPEDQEMQVPEASSTSTAPKSPSKTLALPSPKLARPNLIQRSSSAGAVVPTTAMEKMVLDCCNRLEEIVEQKFKGRINPRRAQSMDGTAAGGSVSVLRASQQHMEDLLERKVGNLEQFIDSRHAELEAYYSSSNENLKKLVLETLQGGNNNSNNNNNNNNNNSSSNTLAASNSALALTTSPPTNTTISSPAPLTREELEAVLDARISAEEAEADATKPLTREELEAVLDARITAEEEADQRPSKALTKEELEAILDARLSAEEQDLRQSITRSGSGSRNTTQEPAESTNSNQGQKSLHAAMERLIQQQQEWIAVQSSTRDLEQQVQFKLDQLEGGGAAAGDASNLQRVESKLESLEKLVLAAIANSAKRKQRSSSKKPSKKLSQIIMTSDSNQNNQQQQNTDGVSAVARSRAAEDVDASSTAQVAGSLATQRVSNAAATNAYSDISVDEKGLEEEEQEEKEQEEGDHVKSFMNTLSKFKELNKQQEDVRDHRLDASDADEGDDDIDSNATMSVDSSLEGGGGGGGIEEDNKILKALQRLESKLNQLDEKLPGVEGHAPILLAEGGANRERSTNARHSREVIVNTDSIEASIRAEHSKLKQWIMEQQDEMNNSSRSEPGQAAGEANNTGSAGIPDSPVTASTLDPKQLRSIQEKLTAIETLASTNQSFLQEQRRQAVPPVPKELPLVEPLGGSGTVDLERKILSHLATMDKSVQFKLDEIYSQVNPKTGPKRRDSDWSTLSEQDSSAVVKVVETQLQELQEAITTQLKESIPDYGMAKSVITENLEDMRQILSEVAISEVELLKTQLGVAEEAEQEALHAILVMREQLEESKEAERRALYTPRAAPQQQKVEDGGFFGLGPFGQLLGQQLRPTSSPSMQNRYPSRNMSMGQQSHASGLSQSASKGLNYYASSRSPKQKLEDWKNQISHLDDKATDLRTMYSQLRGQGPDEWLEQRSQARSVPLPGKPSLKATSEGETKEMEVEIAMALPALAPIPAEVQGDDEGDWI